MIGLAGLNQRVASEIMQIRVRGPPHRWPLSAPNLALPPEIERR